MFWGQLNCPQNMIMLMVMLSRLPEVFCARQLIGQVGWLVDQYRQALRTDIDFISLEFDGQQRFFTFAGIAIQTYIHRCSPKMK
jgi:hypothetical protein